MRASYWLFIFVVGRVERSSGEQCKASRAIETLQAEQSALALEAEAVSGFASSLRIPLMSAQGPRGGR